MKRQILLFLIFMVLFFAGIRAEQTQPSVGAAGTYKIDLQQSQISIEVGTGGMLGFMGHPHHIAARDFSGSVQVSRDNPQESAVEIKIMSESLTETGEFNEKDMNTINTKMKQDVLETTKFPEILFKSTKVTAASVKGSQYNLQIQGDLTLHGVTHPITVPVTVTLNNNRLRANANFKIQRADYNLKTDSAGGGTVKVGKELKVTFQIVATP